MLDSTKAQKILNWYPKYSIEKALKETANFIKNEKKGIDRYDLARTMILQYMS